MAAPVPTFKLVLVGDGGTGKVSWIYFFDIKQRPYVLCLYLVVAIFRHRRPFCHYSLSSLPRRHRQIS